MMQEIKISIPIDALIEGIADRINKGEILQNKIAQPEQPSELITRKQAASVLAVSLATLNSWSKNGTLKSYRINSRVRYKLDEVYSALSLKQKQSKS